MSDDDEFQDGEDEGMDFEDSVPTVVSRHDWGARPGGPMETLKHPVKNVRFTYTGGDMCRSAEQCHAVLQKLQRDHMEKLKLPDIKYNFLVGGDESLIFEGRGWYADADRPEKHDNIRGDCIDIAFIGDFKLECPPWEYDLSGMNVIKLGQHKGYIIQPPEQEVKVIPYRDHMAMDPFSMPRGESGD